MFNFLKFETLSLIFHGPLTLIQMAVKQCVVVRLGVIYDSPGDHRREGCYEVMPWPQSEALHLHLKRARDREGGSEMLGWLTIGGVVPGQG
jgi:hypothetical protein